VGGLRRRAEDARRRRFGHASHRPLTRAAQTAPICTRFPLGL
jgi:hypothetical protein